ncbi:MAG: hypothetical protein RJA87_650 [Pseudomonadota bacterium]|jgi:hypothetical protein
MPNPLDGAVEQLRPAPRPMRRAEASKYLFEQHGIMRAPATLAKLACIGGGPRFQTAGRFPLYRQQELDLWAASILSPLKSSTTDSGQKRDKHHGRLTDGEGRAHG